MARVQIDGVGIVEVPDGTNEEVMASARAIRDRYAVAPVDYREQGLGALVSSGFQRSLEGLKGTALDLLPALGGSIIGADDYAKQQLDEYKERMQKAEQANPTAFKSYKQVDSFGNFLGAGAETLGELGPDVAAFVASLLTGSFGAGALARRGTAEVVEGLAGKLAARKGIELSAAREVINKQVTGALAEKSAKELGGKIGLGAASAGINIPDTLQGIYEDTGELRPDLALTIGSLVAALDTYLPSKLLSQLGSAGKAKLAEEMLKKSSVVPTTWKKEFGKALGTTALGEGLTEGAQDSLQIFASQLAGSKDPFFSPENIDRIITSMFKGTIGGGIVGAPGAAVEASQVKADRLANIAAQKAQQPPVQPPAQINQPPAGEKSAFETQQPDLLGFYKNLEQKPPQAAPKEVDPLAQRTRELFEEFVSKGMPPAQATRQAYEQARAEQQNDKMYSVESGEVADPRIANSRQGVLQFAPPAPEAKPSTQISEQLQAAQKLREINLAHQQAVQEKQAQVEKIARQSQAQQQLNLAGLLPEQKTFRPPTANGAPAAQQQSDLFGERGRPSRTEGIRQGQTQSLQEDLTYQQPQISTVLDAETLKNTGLKPQSGYYKQLLGLDMANPDDQIKLGQVLTAARQNTRMNQAPIEFLRNQAFTELAKQQSLPLTEAPRGTKPAATVSRPNGKSVPVPNRPAPAAGRPAPIKPAGVGVFENVATGLGAGEAVQSSALKPPVKKPLTDMEKALLQAERNLNKDEAKGKDVSKARKELAEERAKLAEPKPKTEEKAEPKVVKAPETIEGLERQIKNNNDYLETIKDPKQKLEIQRENFKFKQQLTELKDITGKREFDKIKNEIIKLAEAGEITDADVGRMLEALESGESYEQSVKNATQALDNIRSNKLFQIIKSTPGVNVGRLAKLIGPKLYGNPDYIATVSIKELIQNSFDAIKEGLELGDITNGEISITMNESDRSITILDNGTGMEAAVLGKEFLQIAGTKKGTTRPSGSLGIAKMLFLFANKELKVTTLKNNKVSVLDTTGETLYEALDDPSFAPDINVEKPTAADLKMFPEGHGTHIRITIPETYINSSTGEETKIDFDGDLYYHKVLMYSPLFDNIEVKFNNKILNIGKNFDIDEYTTFANANFNWGTARIYVTKNQQKKYGNNTHILSNGLWQFSTKIKTNPMDYLSDPIGREFYIDVVPKVKAEDPGYPFELSRQSFSKVAQEDFEKIFNYISVLYRQIDFTSDALDFGYVQYLEPSMIGSKIKVTAKEKIEPKGPEKTAASAINLGDEVKVENGQLIVNGRKIPELNTKDLESVFIDTDSLKVDQSTIKNDKVMLHDNLEIPIERTKAEIKADIDKFQQEMDALDKQVDATYEKDDWESKEQEKLRENLRNEKYAIREKRDKADDELNGFGLTVYSSITDIARYKFGDRFDKFMYEIGDVFKDLRDAVAKHLNYKDLKKEGIGISFDKEYRGVSIRIPFIGLFVNPALPEFSDVTRAAYGTFGTMIHELAHHKVRSHDAAFPAEMQKIILSLKATKGFDLNALENKLLKSFQDNEDIFVFINKEAKKNDARSIGKQFTDGSQQTATGDVPSDMVKSGDKRERPLAVSRNVKSRVEDVAAKQVFRGIPSKNTETVEKQQATLRNKPNVPGVTGEDAQSIFDGFIDKIANAPFMNQNRANALHEVLKKGVFGNALTAILSSLPVNVLGMEAERVGLKGATGIGKLIDEQSQYINGQNEKIEPLVRRAEAWVKQATPEMVKLFNSVVYGSTTSKADPTKEKTDYPEATQKDKTWDANYNKVKAEYNRLSGSGKKLYVDMRNAYSATYNEIVRAINERIETFSVDDTIKAKIKSDIMAKLVAQGKIEPYFALTRKGNYWLSYNMRDKSGQVETYIEAFEYERARTRAIEELKKEGASNIEQFSKLAEYQYTRAPSGSFVNKVLQVLESNKPKLPDNATANQKEKHKAALEKYEENSEEVMRLYISTLPETSFAQSFRKRQNVLGYKEDAVEALRDRLYSTTQQVGRMIYGAKINKLMSDMKTLSKAMTKGTDAKDNKLVNEYIKIFEKHIAANSANNNNIITKTANLVNTLTFNYQLGFNVSSAVVQLAQLPMVVMPYLAGDHSWTDTIKEVGAARRAFFASGYAKTAEMIGSKEKVTGKAMPSMSNYDFDNAKLPAEIRRLKTLYDLAAGEGQLNRSSFYDVLEVDGRKNILNTINTTSGWAFHHADRMNREISLMAAYNLQLAKLHGKGIKGQAAEDAAARYAVDVAKLTNGNIAAGNAPLISKNALGKVLFMYKGYGVSMYYLLFKITRDALQNQDKEVKKAAMRQIAGIYGTAALFSGLQGVPMFGMAAMVYNLFADDDEDDFETATRKYIGEFVYKGLINEITGLDVAGRIGLSDLIFRTNPTSQSATFQDAFLQTFGGPAYGAGSKIMRGLSKIQEGNIERGIEDILPSFLGNAMKSFRYGTEGATTMRGDPMIEDFSIFSIGAQALGFTPAELSLQQAINAKNKGIEKAILDEKNKLLQRYNISDRVGDVEAREEAKEKLMELNRKHPGLGINAETFERSSRAFLDASKRMVNGVQYSKKLEQEMLDNIAAYN